MPPDIPASELSSVVRAVRAQPRRDIGVGVASTVFAVILMIFLHGATLAAWNPSQARFRAQEENQMRSLRQIAVVSSLAVSSSVLAQNAVEWRVQDGGNGHWYQGVRTATQLTWNQARALALALSGHLATFQTAAEAQWCVANVGSDPLLWSASWGPHIGGLQDSKAVSSTSGWNWIDGGAWFPLWGVNDCGADDSCGGQRGLALGRCLEDGPISYNDVDLDSSNGAGGCNGTPSVSYILEFDADCNSDGIVDYGQIRAGELEDANANNIPDCCESQEGCNPCLADVDASGSVNGVDLAAILNTWGTSGGKYPGADVNRDGVVDGADLAEVLNGWGACP